MPANSIKDWLNTFSFAEDSIYTVKLEPCLCLQEKSISFHLSPDSLAYIISEPSNCYEDSLQTILAKDRLSEPSVYPDDEIYKSDNQLLS